MKERRDKKRRERKERRKARLKISKIINITNSLHQIYKAVKKHNVVMVVLCLKDRKSLPAIVSCRRHRTPGSETKTVTHSIAGHHFLFPAVTRVLQSYGTQGDAGQGGCCACSTLASQHKTLCFIDPNHKVLLKMPEISLVIQWLRICFPMQGTWV